MTLIMMLRGTLLTRITGDAGLRNRQMALVPVGRIASDDNVASLSAALGSFFKEANTHVACADADDSKGVIESAIVHATQVFGGYGLRGFAPAGRHGSFKTWSNDADRQAFVAAVTSGSGALLPEVREDTAIADHCHCIGPVWLEDWSELDLKEHFRFSSFNGGASSREKTLLSQLWVIANTQSLAQQLQRAAREVHDLLRREQQQQHRDFTTQKALSKTRTWLALPLEWPVLAKNADSIGGRAGNEHSAEWLSKLGLTLNSRGSTFPVIACYEDSPFAVSISGDDPMLVAHTLNSRYFMSSTELNLLNTILLSDQES